MVQVILVPKIVHPFILNCKACSVLLILFHIPIDDRAVSF